MARTRQKSKQRKAKRLEQERKAAGRPEPPQRTERVQRPIDTAAAPPAPALAEIEEARQEAAAEVVEAGEQAASEVEEARQEAALEAQEATRAAEVATAPEAAPVPTPEPPARKLRRRDRREAEVKEQRRAKPPARPAKPTPKAPKKREPRSRSRVVTFLVQVWAELRRVQWPDRTQVTQATTVVVVFCFIAGAYLATWDWVFSKLIKVIL
jgi:preprotein translocase SecE subunit